jgi:cell division transport system permease protein
MFIIRECLRSIKRSPISLVLIALTIGVGVGLTAVFAYVAYSARMELARIERSITIDVYFDPSLDNETARTIFDREISAKPGVIDPHFVTKEEALQEYESGTGQDVRSVLGENPLPAGARLRLSEPSVQALDKKINELKAVNGIDEAQADQQLSKSLADKSQLLDQLTMWLAILIGVVILVVVAVATRLTVEIRKQTLRIMRLLGASSWKVNAPFVLEGSLAGLCGGVVATLVLLGLDNLAFQTILPNLSLDLSSKVGMLWIAALLGMGTLLGFLGSLLSVTLRTKKI